MSLSFSIKGGFVVIKRIAAVCLCAALMCGIFMLAGCATSENRELTGIKIAGEPKKLEYELFDENGIEAGFKVNGGKLTDNDFMPENIRAKYATADSPKQKLSELIDSAEFYLNLNLEGLIAVASYSNGTTETVKNKDLTVTIADPANLGELFKEYMAPDTLEKLTSEPDDEFDMSYLGNLAEMMKKGVCRSYTIRVAYKGFEDEFKVSVFTRNGEWQEDIITERYQFVRIEDSQGERAVPLSAMDFDGTAYDQDEDDPEHFVTYGMIIETEGMFVVVKDRETGEERKIPMTEENSELYLSISCMNGTYPPSGEYEAQGAIMFECEPTEKYPDTRQSFEFTYKVVVNNDLG